MEKKIPTGALAKMVNTYQWLCPLCTRCGLRTNPNNYLLLEHLRGQGINEDYISSLSTTMCHCRAAMMLQEKIVPNISTTKNPLERIICRS